MRSNAHLRDSDDPLPVNGIKEQAFLLETRMSPSTISSPPLELFTVGYRPAAVHTVPCQGERCSFAWRISACLTSIPIPVDL
jgi:hypothetical protein